MNVQRTERGWAGHFICADRCRFRRNTLLTHNDTNVVVSTVGLYEVDGEFREVGHGRYFETMVFHGKDVEGRWIDADVTKQIFPDSDWCIAEIDADDKANDMHEAVVDELTEKLQQGTIL